MKRAHDKTFPVMILLSVGLLLGACAGTDARTAPAVSAGAAGFSPDAPEWVKTGKVRGYLPDFYLMGMGYSPPEMPEADAYDQARLSAFTDISTQIETFVSNEFTSIQRSVFHNEDVDELVDLKSVSRQVSKEVLSGVEVVRRYYDPQTGTACVFAALQRESFGRRLVKQAEGARAGADGFWKAALEAKASDAPSECMKSLVQAEGAMDTVIDAHLKAIAVKAPSSMLHRIDELNDTQFRAKITSVLSTFSNGIRMRVLSGGEQRATLTGLLKEEVVVEVLLEADSKTTPLKSFPIRANVKDPGAAQVVSSGGTTDGKGHFSFTLQELKATGSAANRVTVALDYQALNRKIRIPGPSFEVTYFMPTRDTTRIGVVLFETIDHEENEIPFTGSAIKEALTDLGFQVIRVEINEPVEQVAALSMKALNERFSGLCDYLIVGTAEAEYSSEVAQIIFYYSRLVIDALELDTGKTIHFEVPMGQDTKGSGKNKNESSRNSLMKAARVMVGDPKSGSLGLLAEKFVGRFDEGVDWSE